MIAIRSRGALRLQTREAKLRLADATAKSMSADVPALTSHKGFPVAGFTTVKRPRATESTYWPSMKWRVSYRTPAARACQSFVVKDVKFMRRTPNALRLMPQIRGLYGIRNYSEFSYGSFGGRASAINGMRATSCRRNAAAAGAACAPSAASWPK